MLASAQFIYSFVESIKSYMKQSNHVLYILFQQGAIHIDSPYKTHTIMTFKELSNKPWRECHVNIAEYQVPEDRIIGT